MLLQNWQGFTHIDDPIKGSIPQSAFAGHLESIAHTARRTLAKRTIEDVCKITDDVTWWFKDVYPEMNLEDNLLTRTHSQVCQLGSGLFGEEFGGDEYHAAMALMLVNEALRLDDKAASVAAIDAAEAAEYAFNFMAKERLKQRLHDEAAQKAVEKYKRAEAEKKREHMTDLSNEKHRKNREVRKYAIKLAQEIRESDKTCSLYKIAHEILVQVEKKAGEVKWTFSKKRLSTTVQEWLGEAKKNNLL